MTPPTKKKKGSFEIGVNLRVTQCFDKGGRNYMEDFSKYYFEKDPSNNQSVIFAFFGVFDGHGGTEAADLANQNLMEEIKRQDDFWSQDDSEVLHAIRQGFLKTHEKMVEEREKWPLTPSGFQSTAGTTASIAIIRNRKLYLGHVGDSAVVIGCCGSETKDAITDNWSGTALTVEHKPDHPDERRRIEAHGGSVRRKAGIHRVVWNRPKTSKAMTATASTTPVQTAAEYEEIPFLAVARSLGDLWSFDPETREFHVSPEPDISVYELRPNEHRCLIIGSDGLWNVIKPETAVELVRLCERETEARVFADAHASPTFFYHPAGTLVQFALERCQARKVRADNVTALVVMIDPPGKPMTQLRLDRRRLLFARLGLEERPADDGQSAPGLLADAAVGVRRFLVESQRAVGRDACSSPTSAGAVPAAPLLPASPELINAPAARASRGKSLPALTVLRNVLQSSDGFPLLVEAWTEACWRDMLAYCRQAGLAGAGSGGQLDAQAVMDHLMDMDAKYRKEALQAVPTVLSMKRAFARDREMSVCLSQIPLLSREWTQLLVMTSSNPSSPTSPPVHPPGHSPGPPLSSPTGPPSPSACRRWLDRRERILSHLYQMLGRKMPNELSRDAQDCLRAHVAREVSQRMRVSRPAELEQHLASPQEEVEVEVKVKEEPTVRTRRQRRLTANGGASPESSPPGKKLQLRRVVRPQAKPPAEETHLSLPVASPPLSRTRSGHGARPEPAIRSPLRARGKSDSGLPSPPPPEPSPSALATRAVPNLGPGATSPALAQLSLLASSPARPPAQNGANDGPTVMPWRRVNRRHSRQAKEDQDPEMTARVNHLMEKLVVVVQPAPEDVLKSCQAAQKPKEPAEPPKPRPVLLPSSTKRAPTAAASLKRKRKSESDADKPPPASAPPKLSVPENFNTYRNYKAFFKKVIVDASAEAKLEEVMRSVTYRQVHPLSLTQSPSPTLGARPVLTPSPAMPVETAAADKEPKRLRLDAQLLETPPVSAGRRSLRLRSNRSE